MVRHIFLTCFFSLQKRHNGRKFSIFFALPIFNSWDFLSNEFNCEMSHFTKKSCISDFLYINKAQKLGICGPKPNCLRCRCCFSYSSTSLEWRWQIYNIIVAFSRNKFAKKLDLAKNFTLFGRCCQRQDGGIKGLAPRQAATGK